MDDLMASETAAARQLAAALDAIDAALDGQHSGVDAFVSALAGPVASFDAAAKALLRPDGEAA